MELVDEAGDVEEGEDGEDLFVVGGRDLADLETLGYYVLVGYHDLLVSVSVLTRGRGENKRRARMCRGKKGISE